MSLSLASLKNAKLCVDLIKFDIALKVKSPKDK